MGFTVNSHYRNVLLNTCVDQCSINVKEDQPHGWACALQHKNSESGLFSFPDPRRFSLARFFDGLHCTDCTESLAHTRNRLQKSRVFTLNYRSQGAKRLNRAFSLASAVSLSVFALPLQTFLWRLRAFAKIRTVSVCFSRCCSRDMMTTLFTYFYFFFFVCMFAHAKRE